ncbi:MAG: DNA polymerase III subunit gamma/tau [Planctomycetota bacterium]|nr:DNA polymerase III subunit gamma/tau [Planctomycetota bacterium]
MAYTVLARRYRSQDFDEVVGQEAVAQTLKNAIAQGRVAHAYLFVGTRGVGKTSMARIFAKSLAGGSPEVDRAIMTGQDTDVIEIDAASNRGVDEARELIANCIYRPLRGKFKVYIVDEVHMLTTEAFNALLKTLEEPPEHVKFVLCTTEAHKVPATIQSRCQRFDFRNLTSSEIAGHLRAVCQKENVPADPDLLFAIGRLAAGSMRDGLSLLDRVMAAAGNGQRLTRELLEKLLGLPQQELVAALVDALSSSDPGAALQKADALLARGVAMDQLLDTLIDRLRSLMLIAACGESTPLVEASDELRRELAQQARAFDAASLVHMIALCESVQRGSKSSFAPRALLDALVVRLAMTEKIADLAALVALPKPADTGPQKKA